MILDNKTKKEIKAELKDLVGDFVGATNAESKLKIKALGINEYRTNAHDLFSDMVTMGKGLFTKHNSQELGDIIKGVEKLTPWKTGLGAVISIVGLCCLPSLNNYLTKKEQEKTATVHIKILLPKSF